MTEGALRAYLLGKLSESEVERVEARLIDDPDVFAQMQTAEDDLFDAFARESLDADERARFLEKFGADRPRQRFAQAFVTRTSSRKVLPFYQQRWVGLAAAAGLAIVVGVFLIPRQRGTEAPPASATVPATTAVPAVPITSRVSLALGTSRAAGASVQVVIARDASRVDFSVRLNPADKFAAYAAEIRSRSDLIIWGDAIQAATEGGDLVAHAIVPVDRLPAGTYEIAIRGGASASSLDDLGFVTIEVSRSQ